LKLEEIGLTTVNCKVMHFSTTFLEYDISISIDESVPNRVKGL